MQHCSPSCVVCRDTKRRGIADRCGLQHEAADDGEDRGVGGDADSDGEHHRQHKSRRRGEPPQRVGKVLPQSCHAVTRRSCHLRARIKMGSRIQTKNAESSMPDSNGFWVRYTASPAPRFIGDTECDFASPLSSLARSGCLRKPVTARGPATESEGQGDHRVRAAGPGSISKADRRSSCCPGEGEG